MCNTRSSNNNSASALWFLLSYIVGIAATSISLRRNGKEKCCREKIKDEKKTQYQVINDVLLEWRR